MHLFIAVIALLALAGCDEARIKNNIECKTYADQGACSTDARCMWHEKDDGTFRCKGKHEG